MTENWLTLKPRYPALFGVVILTLLVFGFSLLDWSNSELLEPLLRASWNKVFEQHQYYRLWTSLFIHADGSHLFSNMILFVPMLFLLSSYFGSWLWPLSAVFVGGVINAIVLWTLPPDVSLIGISGVDNWLGAVWLTLFFLIDRRESKRRRFAIALFITFVLFVPDTYKPGISYLSHFVGYILGIFSGLLFYNLRKPQFKKVEVFENILEEEYFDPTDAGAVKVSQDELSNL